MSLDLLVVVHHHFYFPFLSFVPQLMMIATGVFLISSQIKSSMSLIALQGLTLTPAGVAASSMNQL